MSRVTTLVLFVASLIGPTPAVTAQTASDVAALEAIELPVSLERVRRKLDRLPTSEEARLALRLSYYIDVYGRAPALNLLEGFDVHNGPVPYYSTHAELMAVMTPREFQPTVANLGNVIGWAWEQLQPGR